MACRYGIILSREVSIHQGVLHLARALPEGAPALAPAAVPNQFLMLSTSPSPSDSFNDLPERTRRLSAKVSLRRRLQLWVDKARWRLAAGGERISADITTQPRPGRGEALRDAHRTLAKRMHSHPAIRRVMPHLSCVERALAKHGSRALRKLPVPVLQRSLVQLALLQRDEEPAMEAADMRVLRLRLMEAIALRSSAQQLAQTGTAGQAVSSGFASSQSGFSGYDSQGDSSLDSGFSNQGSDTAAALQGLAHDDELFDGLVLDDSGPDQPDDAYDYQPAPRRGIRR